MSRSEHGRPDDDLAAKVIPFLLLPSAWAGPEGERLFLVVIDPAGGTERLAGDVRHLKGAAAGKCYMGAAPKGSVLLTISVEMPAPEGELVCRFEGVPFPSGATSAGAIPGASLGRVVAGVGPGANMVLLTVDEFQPRVVCECEALSRREGCRKEDALEDWDALAGKDMWECGVTTRP